MTAHRVGIMGGTYNPVHYGHVIAARVAAELLDLESVILSPVSRPWHKTAQDLAPAEDRLSMLELALAEDPEFLVTTVDLDRGGDTYTVDTLDDLDALFAEQYPDETVEWFFLAGADAISGLASWKSPEELLRRAQFVAVTRPGHELVLPEVEGADDIMVLEIDAANISSTEVRERAARGESLDELVPELVAEYIVEHGLYSSPGA